VVRGARAKRLRRITRGGLEDDMRVDERLLFQDPVSGQVRTSGRRLRYREAKRLWRRRRELEP
jgi:hypothetical protein